MAKNQWCANQFISNPNLNPGTSNPNSPFVTIMACTWRGESMCTCVLWYNPTLYTTLVWSKYKKWCNRTDHQWHINLYHSATFDGTYVWKQLSYNNVFTFVKWKINIYHIHPEKCTEHFTLQFVHYFCRTFLANMSGYQPIHIQLLLHMDKP